MPLDFNLPLRTVWPGFLMPPHLREPRCGACEHGYSPYGEHLQRRWYGHVPFHPSETGSPPLSARTPIVRARAEHNIAQAPGYYGTGEQAIAREAARLARLFNSAWNHHLDQDDADALIAEGRLRALTHTFVPGQGWTPNEPAPAVTAAQVNLWSLHGMGHDSINAMIVIRAACMRAGQPVHCARCHGHGSVEGYPGQREQAQAWTPTDPPAGDGWQLWEQTSEGSPISPVFATADDLATWMSDPARGDQWVPGTVAASFIAQGWAPTLVADEHHGVVSGVEAVGVAAVATTGPAHPGEVPE